MNDPLDILEGAPIESGLPPATRLADFPKPTPDEQNPAALLRDRFLRKGGGLVIVAPSGVGKSTFATGATSAESDPRGR